MPRFHIFSISLLLAGALSAQTPPPVPPSYQDLFNTLTTQISGFDATVSAGWNGSTYPYLNAPQLEAASSDSYTNLLKTNYFVQTLTPQLNELVALGANAVTVHINFPILYQPFYASNPTEYQSFVSFYQQLAQEIHSRGMKIVVESSIGLPVAGNEAGAYQSYLATLTWSEYMTGRAANALAVAQLVQPDYMSVLTEPDTEASVSGQPNVNTVSGATSLVQQILTTIQTAGVTNVQLGAGAGTWTANYTQYLASYTTLPMNFVDMHIYPINGTDFTEALSAADTIHAAGKEVGVTECWAWKIRNDELGKLGYSAISGRNPFSFWEPVDTSFLQAMVNFANYKQLTFISPFWTAYFFAYLDYNTDGSLPVGTLLPDAELAATNAITAGEFTPTGLAWETQNLPPDTTPPATPAAPTASVIGTTSFTINWVPDKDNVGVSAYNLYRNGTKIYTSSLLVYHDSGLVSGETYTYTLTAQDASGNVSAMSAPLVVETIDITPPSVPTNLTITGVTSNSVSMTWTPSTGIGDVGGYRILKGTSPTSLSIHANVTNPPYTDTPTAPGTKFYYEVEAFNPLGIDSAPGNEVTATTLQ
jgi:chitodextrinase